MKNFLFSAFLLSIIFTTAYAQVTIVRTTTRVVYSRWERNNLNLRLGPEIGIPAGSFKNTNNLGIGASALLDIPIAQSFFNYCLCRI